jgi:epoxyqueuosine reductase
MKLEINRREFLRVSAQSAAVAGIVGVAGINPSATAAENPVNAIDAAYIRSFIVGYTAKSPNNSIRNAANEKAWDEPLVGFSRGDDPLYQFLKEDIGPFYWTPIEIFQLAFPKTTVMPGELTVISWVLPHTESIKAELRKQAKTPSEKWIRARHYGGEFIDELSLNVADLIAFSGYQAVIPSFLKENKETQSSVRYGMSARWSERHAAYVSGLGTFGLCDGLITAKGKAMRCGSVVARIQIPATPRPYKDKDHHAYCLFYAQGKCGACANRCPVGAVKKSGHDKKICVSQYGPTNAYAIKLGLPKEAYGCGFCQTGVPCESRIPV